MSGEPHAPFPLAAEGWGVRGGIARSCAARTPHPSPPPQGGRGRLGFFLRSNPMSGEESGGVLRGCVGGMGQRFGVGTGLRVSARRSREDVTEGSGGWRDTGRSWGRFSFLSFVTFFLVLRAEIRVGIQIVAAARRTNTIFARSYPMSGGRDAPGCGPRGMGLGGFYPSPLPPPSRGGGDSFRHLTHRPIREVPRPP